MAQETMVPGDNGLAGGASAAAQDSNYNSMDALRAFANHLGELAAYKVMADQAGIPKAAGTVVQSTMPGIPTTGIAPLQTHDYQPLPEEGGGYTNHGQRVAFDKSRLINLVGQGVTQALNDKKQRDYVAAQRQYEILMTAMTAMKTMKQGDPGYEHNQNIINDFFSDEKKVKKLEKILGFDAFDAKKEQQKQQDPDYQAMKAAADKVSGQGVLVPGGGTSAGNPGGMSAPMSERIPGVGGTPTNVGNQAPNGLNPLAQKFFGRIPEVRTPPSYIPSPDEVAESWRVAQKLAPTGTDRATFMGKVLDYQKDMGVQLLKNMSDTDVENIKGRWEVLKSQIGEDRALKVALLEHGDKLVDQSIERAKVQIEANKLDLDKLKTAAALDKDQQEKATKLLGAYQDARDAAQKQVQMSQEKLNLLRSKEYNKLHGTVDDKELSAAYDELVSRMKTVDQYSKNVNDITSAIYGIGFSGSGKETVNRLEQRSSSGAGSNSNKPANGANTPAAKSASNGPVQQTGGFVPGSVFDSVRNVADRIFNGPPKETK